MMLTVCSEGSYGSERHQSDAARITCNKSRARRKKAGQRAPLFLGLGRGRFLVRQASEATQFDQLGFHWVFGRQPLDRSMQRLESSILPTMLDQFGVTLGGPVRRDSLFYFFGYEGLRENLGRTITSAVPDLNARQGVLQVAPSPRAEFINVGVHPAAAPYLNAYPAPNGASLGDGTALHSFQFDQTIDQNYVQGRVDYNVTPSAQVFARYTIDEADQRLPTDYPQFPRAFLSRNQFLTTELKQSYTSSFLAAYRLGYSRTRVGQDVEANTTLPPFVPGRRFIGNIDVGGLQRFGTQSSVNVSLTQNVYSVEEACGWLTRAAGPGSSIVRSPGRNRSSSRGGDDAVDGGVARKARRMSSARPAAASSRWASGSPRSPHWSWLGPARGAGPASPEAILS